MNIVGKRIKELRLQQKMSVEELANKIGKNRVTIYRYEKGEIENVPYTILIPLAEALNTTPTYLLGMEEKEYENNNNSCLNELNNCIKKYNFTDEELEDLLKYAKFLISKRDK
ncbi:MAG: helix-turn-helix domain-containing protein [Erysipelotrichaceae bacterium]